MEPARESLQRVARIDAQQCPCCQDRRLRCVQSVAAQRWLGAPGEVSQHNRGPP